MMLLAALLLQSAGPIVGPLNEVEAHFNRPDAGCVAHKLRSSNKVLIFCESEKRYESLKSNVPGRSRFYFASVGRHDQDCEVRFCRSASLVSR